MPFARQKTRVINDREIRVSAGIWKEPGEKCDVYGPFDIEGKKYAIATYYPAWRYRWYFARNFLPVMLSTIWKSLYHRQKNIDELITGIRVYDSRKKPVPVDTRLYTEAYRATRIWLRVFFNPFYSPNTKVYDVTLKLVKRLAGWLKRQGYPDTKSKIEVFYVQQLRHANEQVYAHVDILERHNKLLANITDSFRAISDKASTTQTRELHSLAVRFKSVLTEMADWCEGRAQSWTDFVDAFTAYKQAQEDKENPIKRHGSRAMLDGMVGALITVISGGSIALGTGFSVASDFGYRYLRDLVMRPKWQAKSLLKTAEWYRIRIVEIDSFLKLYEATPRGKLAFRA